MKTPHEKYAGDPAYHKLVDSLASMIELAQFTPSEVREAAVYACALVERRRATYSTPPQYILSNDLNSITCMTCGKTSYNLSDVKKRYCSHCKVFHSNNYLGEDT